MMHSPKKLSRSYTFAGTVEAGLTLVSVALDLDLSGDGMSRKE